MCHYLHQHILQAGHFVDGRVCSWVGDYLFPLAACRVPSSAMNTNQQAEVLGTSFSVFSAIFSNRVLPSVYGEQLIVLSIPEMFRCFHGSFLANDSTRCNTFLNQKFCLMMKVSSLSFPDKKHLVGEMAQWVKSDDLFDSQDPHSDKKRQTPAGCPQRSPLPLNKQTNVKKNQHKPGSVYFRRYSSIITRKVLAAGA